MVRNGVSYCCRIHPSPHCLILFLQSILMWCLLTLQKQEEEGRENSDTEEQVPEATERKEHDSCGQTGLESVQSAQAVELAGTAPEKERGKEVIGPHCLCQLPLEGLFPLGETTICLEVVGVYVMFS